VERGCILHKLKDMSREDRHAFDRWLKANAVVGFVFTAALVAMALIGPDLARTDEAAISNSTAGSEAPVAEGRAVAGAHAKEADESLYPGRRIASCKPAPIAGCLCETGTGQVSIFPQFVSDAADPANPMRDEYSRMVRWLRLTCQAVARSR
jgi:hypothetical protein